MANCKLILILSCLVLVLPVNANETACGVGVVCGLEVDAGQPPAVVVDSGMALDCEGNDLVICDPIPVDISSLPDQTPSSSPGYEDYLNYFEETIDPISPYQTPDSCEGEFCDPSRIYEGYQFELRTDPVISPFESNSQSGSWEPSSTNGFSTWVTVKNVYEDTLILTLDYYDSYDWDISTPINHKSTPFEVEATGKNIGELFIYEGEESDSVVDELTPINPFSAPNSFSDQLGMWEYGQINQGSTHEYVFGSAGNDFSVMGRVLTDIKVTPTIVDDSFSTTTKLETDVSKPFEGLAGLSDPAKIDYDTSFGQSGIPKGTINDMWKKIADTFYKKEGAHGSKGEAGFNLHNFFDSFQERRRLELIAYTSPQLIIPAD